MHDTASRLRAANRALDERAIRRHGAPAAIINAPTDDTAVRRAALALAQHRRIGIDRDPTGVVTIVYPHRVDPAVVTEALRVRELIGATS